ncbi:septum formation initiator family protein [Persicobacter sp. CCB-QB2]|uniref:FtsB family cell division protein n=1 Tax=Persicobacter sp. CCB-QB2 TaxID=1561025 RepID=UPI0006A9A9F2|nr:septum formation initiator family protein [Persicobacter sp. CCB-QB2]
MQEDIERIPAIFRSVYFYLVALFIVWMVFFDSNDWVNQYKLHHKMVELEEEKAFYQKEIEVVQEEREELMTNKALLEKFAREKYLMKKRHEDVYVIEHADQ